jgi:hypothetical protein
MLCPYCHIAYTTEQPCFCQPPVTTQKASPDAVESEGPEGYRRAVFASPEDNRYGFQVEALPDGNQ